MVNSRSEYRVSEVAQRIQKAGGTALPIAADVSRPDQVENMITATVRFFGAVNILVNNAALQVYPEKELEFLHLEEWDQVMAVNARGVFLCSKFAVPEMRRVGGGRIINVASISGHISAGKNSAYSASKGAVISLTREMAVELGPYNITVNAVSPGQTPTRLTALYDPVERHLEDYTGGGETDQNIPLGRRGLIEDYVGPILFFASDLAQYVTGTVLPVDGGVLAKR